MHETESRTGLDWDRDFAPLQSRRGFDSPWVVVAVAVALLALRDVVALLFSPRS